MLKRVECCSQRACGTGGLTHTAIRHGSAVRIIGTKDDVGLHKQSTGRKECRLEMGITWPLPAGNSLIRHAAYCQEDYSSTQPCCKGFLQSSGSDSWQHHLDMQLPFLLANSTLFSDCQANSFYSIDSSSLWLSSSQRVAISTLLCTINALPYPPFYDFLRADS